MLQHVTELSDEMMYGFIMQLSHQEAINLNGLSGHLNSHPGSCVRSKVTRLRSQGSDAGGNVSETLVRVESAYI